MTKLAWDQTSKRMYETGVDHGVLYPASDQGLYDHGYAWNGLTTVTESPSGAESNKQYADNIVYLNLISVEQFGCTIEAFTYPEEFAACDGSAEPEPGVAIGQQPRRSFGLCYRTRVGNDVAGTEFGYKLHLIYGCLAAPSEKAYATINDSPEAITFSWEVSTTPVQMANYKPTASLIIDSTKVDADALGTLEDMLYGTVGQDPMLPLPDAVLAIFSDTVTEVSPTAPTYNSSTHVITIPSITGVTYMINDLEVTGTVTITEDTIVNAVPDVGYKFPDVSDDDWFFSFS